MKKILCFLFIFGGFIFQLRAQKNACDNLVIMYAPPTKIDNLDSTVHESIQRYLKRYLISQQQAFNYKLVEEREDATLELLTSYTLKKPTFQDQTTEIEFTIRDIENPLISRTIIESYNTEDAAFYNAGKDIISHKGSAFLETLQHQNTLYSFFASLSDQKYRHKAAPEQVLLVEAFTAEGLPELNGHLNCLQEFLLKGMQSQVRFVGHNINISFEEEPKATPDNVPVVRILTEIEEFADEYVFSFSTHTRPYIHEITIPKKLITSGQYRPFVEGKVVAAGGGLIGKVVF